MAKKVEMRLVNNSLKKNNTFKLIKKFNIFVINLKNEKDRLDYISFFSIFQLYCE